MKSKIKDPFYKELFSLMFPIAIQNFMLALVSVTDAVMLRFIDQDSMAAVSQAGQIQFFFNLLIMGFSVGVGVLTAQYWGKKDTKTIEKIAPFGMRIVAGIGIVVTLAALLVPSFLMGILTSDSKLIPLGAGYLRAVALSYVLCGITQIYFTLLKNTGFASISSGISSIAVVLNIIFNGLLIFGVGPFPALGIQGAALATVIARACELILAVIATHKKGHVQMRWDLLFTKLEKVYAGDFMKYTSPAIGASLVWGIAFMSYTIIMGHLDSDAVAANSVTSIIRNLSVCFIRGCGGGAGVMVGNLLGAGNLDQAKKYALRLTKLAATLGVVTGLLLIILSGPIVSMVALTEAASGYLQGMLIFCGFNVAAMSINHTVLDGIFGAGGDTKYDMTTNIKAMWCFSLPAALITAFLLKWPAMVVYCFAYSDEIVKLPAVLRRYTKYIWLRNITRESSEITE